MYRILFLLVGALFICRVDGGKGAGGGIAVMSAVSYDKFGEPLMTPAEQQNIYSIVSAKLIKSVELRNILKGPWMEPYENYYEGLNYEHLLRGLECSDPAAVKILQEKRFKEIYALSALLAAIKGCKGVAFKHISRVLDPKTVTEVDLVQFITAVDGWKGNAVLTEMLVAVGGKVEEAQDTLVDLLVNIYLSDLMRFSGLKAVKAAYESKGKAFSPEEAMIKAIEFNNLNLLNELLHDGVDPNFLLVIPTVQDAAVPADVVKFTTSCYRASLKPFIGDKEITPLMYTFALGRGAAADVLASWPTTMATFTPNEGVSVLSVYQHLQPAQQLLVNSALTLRHEHDLNAITAKLAEFGTKSLVDAILKDKPMACIEAYLWYGLEVFSLDAILAATYMGKMEVLEKFAEMGWIDLANMDHALRSLMFEVLTLLPKERAESMVRGLVKAGFDFKFGGVVEDGVYVPSMLDYLLTKRMPYSTIDVWLKLLHADEAVITKKAATTKVGEEQEQLGTLKAALPEFPVDLVCMYAFDSFDKKLLEIVMNYYPDIVTSFMNPRTDETFLFTVLRSYYPATGDNNVLDKLAEAGVDLKAKLPRTQKTKREVELKQVHYDSKTHTGINPYRLCEYGWRRVKARFSIELPLRKTTPIKKPMCDLTAEDYIACMEKRERITQVLQYTVPATTVTFPQKEQRDFCYWIHAGASTDRIDFDDGWQHNVWKFHSSIVCPKFWGEVGQHKEDISDAYYIGPEEHSVFHILLSPRAEHIEDAKIKELLEYFIKKGFHPDFVAKVGEKISYQNAAGNDVEKVTRGWTPFMVAMARKKYEFAEMLVKAGANIRARDHDSTSFAHEYLNYLSRKQKLK